jgi:hypothetical protein
LVRRMAIVVVLLGLFFARRTACGLGGSITAASEVGKGTESVAKIPLGATVMAGALGTGTRRGASDHVG